MTAWADERRGRMAVRIGYGAALLAVLALAAGLNAGAARTGDPKLSGLVAPDWSEKAASATRVAVTTRDAAFSIERDGDVWRVPERDGHPAAPGAFAALDRAIANLRFIERKTADPSKFDRLGLDDPEAGGDGARLIVETAAKERRIALVLGDPRPGGGFYARQVDGGPAFALDGERPDVDAPTDWIDLDFLAIERASIASARVTPAEGPAYTLERANEEQRDFALGQDAVGWTLKTAGAGNGIAAALSRLRFEDVMAEPAEIGAPIGVHEMRTFDGLSLRVEVLADPRAESDEAEARWARIAASADVELASLSAQSYAEALSARTAGWLYQLPPYAPDRLTRPLADLAEPPPQ